MGRGRSKFNLFIGLGIALGLLVVVIATANYPGNRIAFLLFSGAFLLLIGAAIPQPRIYGYTFLAGFLFLGFQLKALAYFAFGIALLEPTGNFNGTSSAWDASLVPATFVA